MLFVILGLLMPTIHDVAKKAGVSIKTVSRVINDEPNVRAKTREAVRTAVKDLNYAPSHHARAMKTGRSGTIAFVTDSVVTSPESTDIARGVAEAASEEGLTLFFLASEPERSPFCGPNFDFIRSAQVDGVIFATHYHREIEIPDAMLDLPLVLVNCFEYEGRFPAIVPDDRLGGHQAASLLIKKGHENVAFLNLPEDVVAAKLRGQGFQSAYERAGMAIPPVLYLKDEQDPDYDHDVQKHVHELFVDKNSRPSALFCGNDKTALKVMGVLRRLGMNVPKDVGVLGFDDFKLIAELVSPGLSTVAIPYLEMGRESVSLLKSYVAADAENRILQPAKMQIPGWVVERESLI